jgi:hypothetical protein
LDEEERLCATALRLEATENSNALLEIAEGKALVITAQTLAEKTRREAEFEIVHLQERHAAEMSSLRSRLLKHIQARSCSCILNTGFSFSCLF